MSIAMSDTSTETDYADFEYQQILYEQSPPTATGSFDRRRTDVLSVSPLSDIGGLANNEVAELVAYRLTVDFDSDDEANEGDQNVGGGLYIEGTFGANTTDEAIPTNYEVVAENDQGIAGEGSARLQSASKDEVFGQYQASASLPFDDQGNGLGGGMHVSDAKIVKNMRSLTGRGPVLDQTDDLTIASRAIASDTVLSPIFRVQVTCIWDVAETSDAGRVFSVPDGAD